MYSEENIEKRIEGLKDSKTSQDKILTELEKFLGQYNKCEFAEWSQDRVQNCLNLPHSAGWVKEWCEHVLRD